MCECFLDPPLIFPPKYHGKVSGFMSLTDDIWNVALTQADGRIQQKR